MRTTVVLDADRDGTKVSLALTRDGDGKIAAYLEPANRKAKAEFSIDADELLNAATRLAMPEGVIPVAPAVGVPA